MFHRINYKNQPKPILLSKGMSNYDKLQKSMNEPVKEYNEIRDLVELQNNSITKLNNIENTKSKKNIDMSTHVSAHKLREMTPHKKGKSKK